jgi:hypothetical protein
MKTETPQPAKKAVENPQNLKENLSDLLEYHMKQEER